MSTVAGVGTAAGFSFAAPSAPGDAMTVAKALTTLKLSGGSSVAIADTLENIQKNLDALQAVAARVTSLGTTSATQQLSVTAAQYAKDGAILALWGAGSGNTVDVTGVSAAGAVAFAAAKPAYVGSFTVADSIVNLQKNLDGLQSLASGGSLRQIVHTGAASTIKITAAQLAANQGALDLIKNQAYALAITEASVSDTLGLGGQPALSANTRVKSIDIKDGTDAIEANLDALQRVGLRLKSISQTDAGNPLTLTASQYNKDSLVIGKIITSYQLDVIKASAAQAARLAANVKVVTVSVSDTAANLGSRWGLIQRLSDSLTAIEVTDPDNALTLTGDQLALGEGLLAKFTNDVDHPYRLAITGVKAGQAADVAAMSHVSAVKIADTADNIVANLASLKSVNDLGLLQAVTLTGRSTTLSLSATKLQGSELAGTQAVLDRIGTGRYGLAVTGVSLSALSDITALSRVVSMEVDGSSAEIAGQLDALHQLGKRLTRVQQSDGGAALSVTQAAFESRASVLAKIDGGYTVNLSGVAAGKALAYALNSHVAGLSVADNGKALAANWTALRSIGATLGSVTKTDAGSLSLTAGDYLAGQSDQLLDKFDAALSFSVHGASVAQALQIGDDAAVDRLEVADDGSAVAGSLSDLAGLVSGGKLAGISLNAGATGLALHAGDLAGAQEVLDLIKGGRYTLSVDQVDVADAAGLLAAQPKIVRIKVSGDAAGIAANLVDLGAAGHKLVAIEQTDAASTALALSGADFDLHRTTLAKIAGGYQVDLSEVAAARAGALAGNTSVRTLQVSDSAANLSLAWTALGTLGGKLTGITQSDADLLQLSAAQWTSTPGLADLFSGTLGVSLSGVSVAELATLGGDAAVQQLQVSDSADAITQAWADLVANAKLSGLRVLDPANALAMTADTYAASTDLLALVDGAAYRVALSDVAVADLATLGADTHVDAMDVVGASGDIAAHFDELAAQAKLGTITLSDDGGTLTLAATQVLGGSATLARIGNAYQVAATGATVAQLVDLQALDDVASVAVTDSAATVAASLVDLEALGSWLSSLHLSDSTPVLALTQQDWSAGAGTLAKIDGSYEVDLSEVDAASVPTLAANATLRQLAVADTAFNVAGQWAALVAAYNDGSGKLTALSLTDADPLLLSAEQQTAGAALITALLPDATIVTA